MTPTIVAGYGKCYNALKDGGCFAIHSGFREGSFGQFVQDNVSATLKASGGVLSGGSETLTIQTVGALTASDLEKGCTNNQSIQAGLLIIDESKDL